MKEAAAQNVAIFYDDRSLNTSYVYEHLAAFSRYSRYNIHYIPATRNIPLSFSLSAYDALIIHFTVRLPFTGHLDSALARAIAAFPKMKIAMPQDEYDMPGVTAMRFKELGIQHVFTTVPEQYRKIFYPEDLSGHVQFHHNLTGYAGADDALTCYARPLEERTTLIGYRGRRLPLWYGALGKEKETIGIGMREICNRLNVACDIEIDEDKRIYGTEWYRFLGSVRATLGSESGTNVVDIDGSIREECEALACSSNLSRQEIYDRAVRCHDNRVCMNQISPKTFEAVETRTALVLFEGEWSNILEPHIHYIPLKKDFSNAREVLSKVADDDYIRDMTERAYNQLIASGRYSYSRFISAVDDVLSSAMPNVATSQFAFIAVPQNSFDSQSTPRGYAYRLPMKYDFLEIQQPSLLPPGKLRDFWRRIPAPLKKPVTAIIDGPCQPFFNRLRFVLAIWRRNRSSASSNISDEQPPP